MKRIVLKSLTLVNFRGEKERTTNFGEHETFIMGENGLGKSRHFDAFMWLLFGKDVMDRKDYEIKSRVDGKPLQHVNCEVSGILMVDGVEMKLRRAYVEDWVKPHGQLELKFKGNHTECAVNDVPMNVTEYKKRINGIVDDGLFKMITNPLFFAGMPWQKQREQLFALAGTITDAEVASDNPDYQALLDKLTGKDMAGYRKEVAQKKAKAKKELEQIQPRIDQTQKLMPAENDWKAIEAKIGELDEQILSIDTQLQDKAEAERIAFEGERKKKDQCNSIIAQQSNILFKAKQAAQEDANAKNAARNQLAQKVKEANTLVGSKQRNADVLEEELKGYQSKKAEYNAEMVKLRAEWHEQNKRKYDGSTICPHCGQPLPESMVKDAESKFNDDVKAEKDKINAKGTKYKGLVETLDAKIAAAQASLDAANKELAEAQAELAAAKKSLADAGEEVKPVVVNPQSIPEWVELQKQYDAIHATIAKPKDDGEDETGEEGEKQPDANEVLKQQKKALVDERDGKRLELSARDTIAKYKANIKELEEQGKKLAQEIASFEKEEFVMDGFTKAKIDECEKRINGMFGHVTFKLYDYTLEGNAVETCVPLVNGVPFFVANTAAKVNAGLDIINALCKFYNVSAPIFIDGRESVNNLIETESQIINLVVTHDKEIIVK